MVFVMADRKSASYVASKKATVIDVARTAGVSKSTVSLVLRGGVGVKARTIEKVNAAIDALGYVYNREAAGLRNRESNMLAIVANDLANPYLAQVIIALETALTDQGLVPVVVNINESEARQRALVASLKEHNVAGFFITPAPETSADWLQGLACAGYPVVCLMREIVGANVPVVVPDNRRGMYLSTKYLIDLGHTRIAFVGGVESISDYQERKEGFLCAMKEADLAVKDSDIEPSSTKREGGQLAVTRVLDRDPSISAMVCFTDVVAYGAYTALRDRGLVPGKDISVVGFDDLEDSRLMSPALTTIRVNAEDIGRVASERMQQCREHSLSSDNDVVGVELVVRSSCCAIGDKVAHSTSVPKG
ncbi:LacI family DNA-binding transcriptional regulator [Enterovibrio norvegicus]|uniref:LacI family DNA-binding transcriptional regulator n=1 Tax=Enterovibrio norvegicus TaxID=188144 RepID=UPI000C85BCBC|nr:LacI family transcriptional regulator [Enterovibrio norvegicus]